MRYSKNERLEKLLGKRPDINGVYLDRPQDFNYQCPTCGNIEMEWSEYNGCVWCEKCNRDYPSCLTATDIDHAIKVFCATVEDINQLFEESEDE